MTRPNLNLEIIGIPIGATLSSYHHPHITCVVVSLYPPRVTFEGETVSLAEAARRVSNSMVSPDLWTTKREK